jgi:aminopeptidase N
VDFVGLTIRSITVDRSADNDDRSGGDHGDKATWTRDAGELTVTPEKFLRKGHEFTTVVRYDGVPQTIQDPLIGPSGFIHTDDGALVAGQPDVAATWFPANDHPRDAASVSVTATVPKGLEAISNGVLKDSRTRDGWTTWSWRADRPMATYLVTLAIGEFDVRHYRADHIEYWDALDPDLFQMPSGNPDGSTFGEVAEGSFARQPEIIDFLSGIFGPYPFRASGGIVDDYPELFFALETQTRPIYSMLFFTDPVGGDDVIVHELAHQWTGDLLRVDSWQHIWLNEGFATYAEWLWLEREGLATVQEQFDAFMSDLLPADDPFWAAPPGDPGPGELFGPAVYLRGALTLHALRQAVGDDAFFRTLQAWTSSQAGAAVTTADFVALAEQESGRDLDALFQTWLYTAGKPAAG